MKTAKYATPDEYGRSCCGYNTDWIHKQIDSRAWYRIAQTGSSYISEFWCVQADSGEVIHMTKYWWDDEWRVTINSVFPMMIKGKPRQCDIPIPRKYLPDYPPNILINEIEAEKPEGWNPHINPPPTPDRELRIWWNDKDRNRGRHETPVRFIKRSK